MNARSPQRKSTAKHFWAKWEFHRWLNEPTLVSASCAVKGFWFTLLNRMMVAESPSLEAPAHEFALLGLCREGEVASLLHELSTRLIADVQEGNGRVRVTCRSMVRQMEISHERSKAAKARWETRRNAENAARSAETGVPVETPAAVDPAQDAELFACTFAYANDVHTSISNSYSSVPDQVGVQGKEPPVAPVAPPVHATEDLQPIAAQIILAHPRAKLRKWSAADIPYTDRIATAKAIRAEAAQAGCTGFEAGVRMLGWMERISQATPEDQWRYLKDIPKFMELREYRIDPEEFARKGAIHAQPAHDQPQGGSRPSPSLERRDRSRAAILAAGEYFAAFTGADPHGTTAGPVPTPGAGRDDRAPVDGRAAGDGSPARGKPPGRVVEGHLAGSGSPEVHAHTG